MTKNLLRTGVLSTVALAAAFANAQQIQVHVDHNPVRFVGQQPAYLNGRVLVPLRGVFEEMGAVVSWNQASRTINAVRGDRDVQLRIGDRTAYVDGRAVAMDVPASVINGRTLVPIRFLSESLGAEVTWNNYDNLVLINTLESGRAQVFRPNESGDVNVRTEILNENTIIPVRLDQRLYSNEARVGDRFTATVRTGSDRFYGGMIPAGARVEGRVVTARPRSGNDGGILELDFERLRLPNGSSYPIDGSLVSLNAEGIERTENGMLRNRNSTRDNRNVFAGYGAGAGLIVGLLTRRPLEGALLGGVLGYIAGQVQVDRNRPNDVRLEQNAEFGIQLNRQVAIRQEDIR